MDNILNINREEVLRYLGYKNQSLDFELSGLIDSCIAQCLDISAPRYCYQFFDCHGISQSESASSSPGIQLEHTNIMLTGENIYSHLKNASKVAIIAATLGTNYDNKMRILQARSMTQSLIFDACGSEYIEKVCDSVQAEIRLLALKDSFTMTSRFSPGYGDFPLSQQAEILQLLNSSLKIGLTCTTSYIMLPRKSITAVIGFIPASKKHENNDKSQTACHICQFKLNCNLKKEGLHCGH